MSYNKKKKTKFRIFSSLSLQAEKLHIFDTFLLHKPSTEQNTLPFEVSKEKN